MATYLIRRILLMIPTLFGITAVVFFIMTAAPGDVAEMLLSREGEMQPGERQARQAYLRKRYGLDRPVIIQYVRWLNRISPLGFGTSSEQQFTDEQSDQARQLLLDAEHLMSEQRITESMEMTRAIAGYLGEDLPQAAQRVIQDTQDPQRVFELLIDLDTLRRRELDEPAADPDADPDADADADADADLPDAFDERDQQRVNRRFVATMKHLLEHDPPAAQALAVERLRIDAAGLDRILLSQLSFKKPDMGSSFVKRRPVSDLIAEALPITILLNLLSIPLVYSMAIGAGVYAARFRGKTFDVASGVTMLAMWSIPTIWAGIMLQGLLANADGWVRWFPSSGLGSIDADAMTFLPSQDGEGQWQRGWLLDLLWHLVLPVVCLSYGSFAFVSKLTRGAVLENIMADYVRTARAKGVHGRDVLWRHAFRNSLLPLITVAAFIIPGLLGGSIIVEFIFGIEGMGKLVVDSIKLKDQEVVMAVTLISGVLTLIAYLIADILYAAVDPRVAYE